MLEWCRRTAKHNKINGNIEAQHTQCCAFQCRHINHVYLSGNMQQERCTCLPKHINHAAVMTTNDVIKRPAGQSSGDVSNRSPWSRSRSPSGSTGQQQRSTGHHTSRLTQTDPGYQTTWSQFYEPSTTAGELTRRLNATTWKCIQPFRLVSLELKVSLLTANIDQCPEVQRRTGVWLTVRQDPTVFTSTGGRLEAESFGTGCRC